MSHSRWIIHRSSIRNFSSSDDFLAAFNCVDRLFCKSLLLCNGFGNVVSAEHDSVVGWWDCFVLVECSHRVRLRLRCDSSILMITSIHSTAYGWLMLAVIFVSLALLSDRRDHLWVAFRAGETSLSHDENSDDPGFAKPHAARGALD